MLKNFKVMLSINGHSDEMEKKLSYKNQDRISYICKSNKIFCTHRLSNQDCIINGDKRKLSKTKTRKNLQYMFKLNQNWSLKF